MMELRIIAEFSKDPVWVNAFKEGKDLHSELASLTFDVPVIDVEKPFPVKPDISYRDVQKTLNFGLAYGMSYYKLADSISITEDEAKSIIDRFFSMVPKVKEFLDYCGKFATDNGYIRSGKPYRRIRWFEGYTDKTNLKKQGEIDRAARNLPIQATNADIIKEAWIRIRSYIKNNNYPAIMINSIYDEILTECKEEKANEWAIIMSGIMKESAEVVLKTVPIKIDCKVSNCWQK